MRKSNFKLNLNKRVVSKLNERKIIGGRQDISEVETCPWSDWICMKTDKCLSDDYKCPWSGPNTQ